MTATVRATRIACASFSGRARVAALLGEVQIPKQVEMATYVYERQVEYWTSRQIEDFLMNAGFYIFTYPIEQRVEKYIPADFIFRVDGLVKLFGIQYKVLYKNSKDHWKLNKQQHSTLQKFPWISYGFSELKSITQARNSLHYLRLYKNNIPFVSKVNYPDPSRLFFTKWAAFYKKLLDCNEGFKVRSRDELMNALTPYIGGQLPDRVIEIIGEMADIFIINVESKEAVHLSPQLRLDNLEE